MSQARPPRQRRRRRVFPDLPLELERQLVEFIELLAEIQAKRDYQALRERRQTRAVDDRPKST